MIPGSHQLEGVLGALTRWGGDRETLTRAAELYWSAAYHAPEWPLNIRRWHERILPMLRRNGGTIHQTIAKADTSEAQRIADALLLFSRAALISKAAPPHVRSETLQLDPLSRPPSVRLPAVVG